jgi:SWI/SNF-related matrix-associated actin-dependent regulator 1 of chromatin subfamily A
VFATHTKTLDILQEKFGKICVRVDGGTSGPARDQAVQDFQNRKDIRLFLGNIKAAGVGLTLTAAAATCFLEMGWTPGEHDQAEDRVHRIGQEADSVSAYYLIADGTIERSIASMLDVKREGLDMVLDGKKTQESSMLSALLDDLKEARR